MVTRRTLLAAAALLPTRPAAANLPNWPEILQTHVDTQGRVDFAAIARNPAPLDATVAAIAATDPAAIPDPDTRLAFLINAYNALAMAGIIRRGIPTSLSLLDRVGFFKFTTVTVGGRRTSLYDLENDVIRPIGDARVHFALNCMSVSCPRLPQTQFTGPALNTQLETAARLFFGEPRNLQLDEAARTMTASAILDFYTADFLHHAPTLPAYVNLFRNPPIPVTYRTRFFAYDWTINRQPGT